jgi:hypothetical protein
MHDLLPSFPFNLHHGLEISCGASTDNYYILLYLADAFLVAKTQSLCSVKIYGTIQNEQNYVSYETVADPSLEPAQLERHPNVVWVIPIRCSLHATHNPSIAKRAILVSWFSPFWKVLEPSRHVSLVLPGFFLLFSIFFKKMVFIYYYFFSCLFHF